MNENGVKPYTDFLLPANVVSKIDVSRLASEAERVDNELTAAAIRNDGNNDKPALSPQFGDFLTKNEISLDDGGVRTELIKQLRLLKDKVPVVHMTFAVTADGESLRQIIDWLRASAHPQTVIAVGLQPGLVAGAYIRTPNHVHDFSMRHAMDGQRDVLIKELEALRGSK